MDLDELQRSIKVNNFSGLEINGHRFAKQWHRGTAATRAKSINPNNGLILSEVKHLSSYESLLENIGKNMDAIKRIPTDKSIEFINQIRSFLADNQEIIVNTVCIESGRPKWDVQIEFDSSISHLDKFIRLGDSIEELIIRLAKESLPSGDFVINPLGITACYLSFSKPIYGLINCIASCIIARSPLIVVSTQNVILTSYAFSWMDELLNLPEGFINFIVGSYEEFKNLITDKRIAVVIYNGSREHCQTMLRDKKLSRKQLLLHSGGKNSVLVHSSADVDLAVKCTAIGAFRSAGQLGSATSRVFVYRSLRERFQEKIVELARSLKIGRTDIGLFEAGAEQSSRGPDLGPLYSAKAREKFLRFQTMATRESEETLFWGRSLPDIPQGYFVTPGIHYLKSLDTTSSYQSNVLFCPDLAIYEYDVLDNAIECVNATDSPYVVSFIGDASILAERRLHIMAPNVLNNIPTSEVAVNLPLVGGFTRHMHRFQDMALALYLTRPQVVASWQKGSEHGFQDWQNIYQS